MSVSLLLFLKTFSKEAIRKVRLVEDYRDKHKNCNVDVHIDDKGVSVYDKNKLLIKIEP